MLAFTCDSFPKSPLRACTAAQILLSLKHLDRRDGLHKESEIQPVPKESECRPRCFQQMSFLFFDGSTTYYGLEDGYIYEIQNTTIKWHQKTVDLHLLALKV